MSVFSPGSKLYCMVLRHEVTESIDVGARGPVDWTEGWLYYVGRSQWGWSSRAKRLLDSSRNCHWHIDYFETSDQAELRVVLPVDVDPDRECGFADYLRKNTSLTPIEEGLGASDCGPDCRGHVLTGESEPGVVGRRLSESDFAPDGAVVFRADRCDWVQPDALQV